MAHVYDPQRSLTEDFRSFCMAHKDELFTLQCEEGDVELNGRFLLINLIIIHPLVSRHRPISRDKHLFLSGIYGGKVHAEILTRIRQTLEDYGYPRDELSHDLIMTVTNMHNLCYEHLAGYVCTMDIFKIAETMAQPEVRDVCLVPYGDVTDGNIHRMETAFKEQSKKALDLLMGDTLKVNAFRPSLICNAVRPNQFAQFLVSAGPRTDTDDKLFTRPVVGSFLSGMTGILDLAIESRSAAKSTHYNKTEMSKAQYFNRRVHLQNSSQRFLYPGDCGSTRTLTYHPTRTTVERFLGKFYLNDQGELTELTRERFGEVVGRPTQMRATPLCEYTDGYCEVCGGTVTKSFPREGDVGFLANVNTGAPVAQQVLSSKHLSATKAMQYTIPSAFDSFLFSSTSDIFIRSEIRGKIGELVLGFDPKDISRINDLRYVVDERELNAAYFTDIKWMSIGKLKEDDTILVGSTRTSMKGTSDTYPHFTPEILAVIRKYPGDLIEQDGKIWLSLRHINPELPIMQCTVVNDSVRGFVKRFSDFITKNIEYQSSLNTALEIVTKMVWDEGNVPTHITHIETLVRSCLISGPTNFHVPVVTNPDEVMFGPLNKIIPMRSIGALFAYQNIDQAMSNPVTYITPKETSIFDHYMAFADDVAEKQYYPVPTGGMAVTEPLSLE